MRLNRLLKADDIQHLIWLNVFYRTIKGLSVYVRR